MRIPLNEQKKCCLPCPSFRMIQSIYEFYKNGRYSYGHKKLYCKIVSSYLKDNFAGTVKKLMAKKEALYLLKLAENMYQDECMGLPEITELIERAEVA